MGLFKKKEIPDIMLDIGDLKNKKFAVTKKWVEENLDNVKKALKEKKLEEKLKVTKGDEPVIKVTGQVLEYAKQEDGYILCTWHGMVVGLLIRFGIACASNNQSAIKALYLMTTKLIKDKNKYPLKPDEVDGGNGKKCDHVDMWRRIQKVHKALPALDKLYNNDVHQEFIAYRGPRYGNLSIKNKKRDGIYSMSHKAEKEMDSILGTDFSKQDEERRQKEEKRKQKKKESPQKETGEFKMTKEQIEEVDKGLKAAGIGI